MRWRIAISDLVGDTRLIRELLAALAISIINDGGDTFLVGEVFEKQSSHDAVRDIAKRLMRRFPSLRMMTQRFDVAFRLAPFMSIVLTALGQSITLSPLKRASLDVPLLARH